MAVIPNKDGTFIQREAEKERRANAYPRLVEALKEAIALTPPDSAFLESRIALLRELGEAE